MREPSFCEEIFRPDDVIEQKILDEVPDHISRELPGANKMLQDQMWVSVIKWIQDMEGFGRADAITATSPDQCQQPRTNLLCTLAQHRPNVGGGVIIEHQAAAATIVRKFHDAGLINMRIGKNHETALLRAASVGNMEVAWLLLEYGAGIPLWLLTLWLIPLWLMHS